MLLIGAIALGAAPMARADDAGAWGGLYRSRDAGQTWFALDAGLFIAAANAIAIDPRDGDHLLYGTDARLLRSINGGRDWRPVDAIAGPVFAVVLSSDARHALAANASALYRSDDLSQWTVVDGVPEAIPVSTLAYVGETVLLAAETGLYASADHGRTWRRVGAGLPPRAAAQLLCIGPGDSAALALVDGNLFVTDDRGENWRAVGAGLAPNLTQAVSARPDGQQVWAAGEDRIFQATDPRSGWREHGKPLPGGKEIIRALWVSDDGRRVTLATASGLVQSSDAAQSWQPVAGNLPAHLDAGLLARDHRDNATQYVGFAVRPYGEAWRQARDATRDARKRRQWITYGAVALGCSVIAALFAWRAWSAARKT